MHAYLQCTLQNLIVHCEFKTCSAQHMQLRAFYVFYSFGGFSTGGIEINKKATPLQERFGALVRIHLTVYILNSQCMCTYPRFITLDHTFYSVRSITRGRGGFRSLAGANGSVAANPLLIDYV